MEIFGGGLVCFLGALLVIGFVFLANAIRIIHGEHRSITAVLSGLGELARTLQDPAIRPGFAVLHAMIRYIDAFPERQHHPKEEAFLFAPIVNRCNYFNLKHY